MPPPYVSVYPVLIAAGGHWGTVCADGSAVNPAGPSPPCVAAAECALPSVRNAGTNLCDCPAPNIGAAGADAPGDCHGENALHIAAEAGDLVSVIYLITAHMADVNATTSAGEPPLHAAARNGHVSVIATLLAAGADVNGRSGAGETPLRVSHADAVAPLLAAGGHWGTVCEGENVVNPDGHSPPCVEVAACALPSVLNTRTNRCDCPAPNIGADGEDPPGHCHGGDALLEAAKAGDLVSVSYLITVHMADVDVKDSAGETPLHHAAGNGHVSVVATLLAAGAAVTVKDNDGETPLHNAAGNGHVSVVATLLAAGGGCGCERQ